MSFSYISTTKEALFSSTLLSHSNNINKAGIICDSEPSLPALSNCGCRFPFLPKHMLQGGKKLLLLQSYFCLSWYLTAEVPRLGL